MSNATSTTGVNRWIVVSCFLLFIGLVVLRKDTLIVTSYININLFGSNKSRGGGNVANTDHKFINVAKGKLATQSSVFKSYGANLAVDGDIRTFSHTNDDSAWIHIDLQKSYYVHSINVLNRWCRDQKDHPGCLCRLSNAKLLLLDKDGVIVETRDFEDTCGVGTIVEEFDDGCLFEDASSDFSACLPTAQKVKIESTTGEQIQVFEVQVISPGIYHSAIVEHQYSPTKVFSENNETKYADKTMGGDENAPQNGAQKAGTTPMTSYEHPTPIWMYWKQGWDHLSSIKEGKYKMDAKCVTGMMKLHNNTNFTLKLVTDANIDDYAPTTASLIKNETLSVIQARLWSDLVRLELLYRHGGIWADTSICPLLPFGNVIDKYLDTSMGHESESFFAPTLRKKIPASLEQNASICHIWKKSSAEEFRLASTWFMAVSSPGNSLIFEWQKLLMHHMTTLPNPNTPYYLSHCALAQASMYNKTVAKIWQSTCERQKLLRDLKLTPMPCFDGGFIKHPNQNGLLHCSLVKKPRDENVIAIIDQKYSSL